MTNNKVEITVVNTPSYIVSECPHCGEEIKIDYNDFLDMMTHYYFQDWIGEVIECPECGKEVEIETVDWD